MNITSIFDLGRPEVVKAMDSDGNVKVSFGLEQMVGRQQMLTK
jgi:hypothetical protein